jgi:hypothetical protein
MHYLKHIFSDRQFYQEITQPNLAAISRLLNTQKTLVQLLKGNRVEITYKLKVSLLLIK